MPHIHHPIPEFPYGLRWFFCSQSSNLGWYTVILSSQKFCALKFSYGYNGIAFQELFNQSSLPWLLDPFFNNDARQPVWRGCTCRACSADRAFKRSQVTLGMVKNDTFYQPSRIQRHLEHTNLLTLLQNWSQLQWDVGNQPFFESYRIFFFFKVAVSNVLVAKPTSRSGFVGPTTTLLPESPKL